MRNVVRSTTAATVATLLSVVVLTACDDDKKKGETSASPSATTTSTTTAAASATAEAGGSASAGAAASAAASGGASENAGPAKKDVDATVRDPEAEPKKTVTAQLGGTVSLYVPQWAGTSWTVDKFDRPLGKAKEETIPGFAGPTTPAKHFTWTLNAPTLKAGQSLKATLLNKSSADKTAAPKTFELTINLVAP